MTRAVLVVIIFALAAGVLASARWAFLPHRSLPRHRARHLRIRLRLRLHPGRGHATGLELFLRWGRLASFRESKRTRPSLPAAYRWRHPECHSLYLGRAHHGHGLRVSVQEHGAIIGPPRSFKTALLSRLVMDAPGAVVSTSSKPDVFSLTSGLRSQRGPVFVFNPQNIGGIPSNVRWSPLDGCLDPATTIRRADAFSQAVSTGGTEDGSFWAGKASDGLRGFFAAAAIVESDMRLVGQWVGSDRLSDPVGILASAGRDEWAAQLAELGGPAEKTAATVRMVMSRAVGFLHDPALASATLPARGQGFSIDEFLLQHGTLYMVARGNGDDCTLAPLFAALATEIQHRAVELGARMPGHRLDPPLLMALDEITQICPVPLPAWLADSGGQGVSVWSAFHGVSQLRSRWKDHGAQTILDTSNVRVFLPGLADTETLERAGKLCGQAEWTERRQDRALRADVVSADMIRQMPGGFALLVRGGMAPVIGRLARGWQHKPYRHLRRHGLDVATLTPLPAVAPRPAIPGVVLDDDTAAPPPAVNGHPRPWRQAEGGQP